MRRWALDEQALEHVYNGFIDELSSMLEYLLNVQILQTAFNHIRLVHGLFKDKTEAIDYVPDELGRFEDIHEWNKFAADELEELCVVYLTVYGLALCHLLFQALRKTVAASAKGLNVSRELSGD